MPMTEEPTPADIAAVLSYTNHPDDDVAAEAAVVAATGWPSAQATTFLNANRNWIQERAVEMRAAAHATGGSLQQAAALSAKRDEREALLNKRRAAFMRDLGARLGPNDRVIDAWEPEEVEALAAKHGLRRRS